MAVKIARQPKKIVLIGACRALRPSFQELKRLLQYFRAAGLVEKLAMSALKSLTLAIARLVFSPMMMNTAALAI